MRVVIPRTVLMVALGAAACAPAVSTPIPEVMPEAGSGPPPGTAAPATSTSVWRMAADRDRSNRQSVWVAPVAPVRRSPPRVGSHAEPLARSTPNVRFLDMEDISPEMANASPSAEMLLYDRGPVVMRAQILLDRANFSVGVIDGRAGKNTELAIYWFQHSQGLPPTGVLDAETYTWLTYAAGTDHIVSRFTVDEESLKGPFVPIPKNVYAQAALRCLCYSSALEFLAERYHTTPEILKKLNPRTEFRAVAAGDSIWAPSVEQTLDPSQKPVARIHISKSGNYVQALATDGSIVFHFPSTLGSAYDPSPDGRFEVVSVTRDPVFYYDPTLFSDVSDSKPRAKLPPGPNSPVGTVWIALSREHVGIHGTPTPDTIGSDSSHGCVRLTNWDAEKLADATFEGIPVEFVA